MPKIIKLIVAFIFIHIFVQSQSIPEYDENADVVFERGLENFENGKYADARSLFSKCIFNFGFHHRTSASYIMLAKSEYNLKKYRDALQTIHEFYSNYPGSSYRREADYVSGLIFYRLKKIDSALLFLLKSYDKTDDEYSEERIIKPIHYLYGKYSSASLPDGNIFSGKKTHDLINLLKKEQNTINNVSDQDPDNQGKEKVNGSSQKNNKADNLNKTIGNNAEYKIGIFTIPNNITGKKGREDLETDFLEALKYGVNEFNNGSNIKISLQIISSKQDSLSLAGEINLLANDKSVIGIIGPIYSEQFSIAAPIASKKGIPIISPTATGNGLAASGEYVFQANPDFITRAKSMAIYSVKKMKTKNIAVFAPKNVYGKMMAESFSREVSKRGGNIVASEFYDSDAKRMQKAMMDLVSSIYAKGGELFLSLADETGKENIQKMIRYGVRASLIDSLKYRFKEVNIHSLLGKDARNKAEKMKLKTYAKKNYEVDQPVHSIDAIYIPINSKNDIKNISATLHSYNIEAVVLGTGDYNHVMELDANRKNMDGLVFDSDTYFDITNKNYINFSKKYFDKSGRKVTQYSLFGYDVLGSLLQAIKKGNVTRQTVKNYLSSSDPFQGLHSKISLKSNRINSYLNILEYKNKKISKIYEINVSNE